MASSKNTCSQLMTTDCKRLLEASADFYFFGEGG